MGKYLKVRGIFGNGTAVAATAAAAADAGALVAVRAADAFDAFFLLAVNVVSRQSNNGQDYKGYNDIIHSFSSR
jgi:hypothetical protein